jgi:hypothetical protein
MEIQIRDMINSISFLPDNLDKKNMILVNYYYDDKADQFCSIFLNDEKINIGSVNLGGQLLNKHIFLALYHEYKKVFIDEEGKIGKQDDIENFKKIWGLFNYLFVEPILSSFDFSSINRVFTKCCLRIDQVDYPIDLSQIHNLNCRFTDFGRFKNVHLTSILSGNFTEYMTRIQNIGFVKPESLVVAFGLGKQDSEEILKECRDDQQRQEAALRENLFISAFDEMRQKNVEVYELSGVDVLDKFFSEEYSGKTIQIISHFHEGVLYGTRGSEIVYFYLDEIVEKLKARTYDHSLRKDICIDAMTCSNFDGFQPLLECGIKYMYFSKQKMSTDLIALMVYELYTGHFAKRILANYPYIDGTCYMNEAWSKVERTLYSTMHKENKLQL